MSTTSVQFISAQSFSRPTSCGLIRLDQITNPLRVRFAMPVAGDRVRTAADESMRMFDQIIPVEICTEATCAMAMLSSLLPKNRGLTLLT